ncbi:MAG: hypothetical protein ABUL60_19670, partial [Myxococcales bacterium]
PSWADALALSAAPSWAVELALSATPSWTDALALSVGPSSAVELARTAAPSSLAIMRERTNAILEPTLNRDFQRGRTSCGIVGCDELGRSSLLEADIS